MAESETSYLTDMLQTDLEGRIMELEEYLVSLERQVFSVLEHIPQEHRDLIAGYFCTLAEHERLIAMRAYEKGISRRITPGKFGKHRNID